MLTTEELNELTMQMHAGSMDLDSVRVALRVTVESTQYRAWKDEESEGARCPLPDTNQHRDLLSSIGLADDKSMLVKINVNNGNYVVTDGLWVPSRQRVFPFTDESEILQEYVMSGGHLEWADLLVDPSTGSGNHVVAMGQLPCIACDVNLRAIAYASLNAKLNGREQVSVVWNDLRSGVPAVLRLLGRRKVLFVVNMPFALAPAPLPGDESRGYLPLSSDGGTTGASLTFAALSAIADYVKSCSQENVRVLLLCYSMGNAKDDRWQVVERAKELFGKKCVKWDLQRDRMMWRVDGVKAEPNPMLLSEGLPKKADCRYYVKDNDRSKVLEGYQRLAKDLNAGGWDVLGYGVVQIGC